MNEDLKENKAKLDEEILLDKLHLLSRRKSKLQEQTHAELEQLQEKTKTQDDSVPKSKVLSILKRCVNKIIRVNALKRGRDIILQTTETGNLFVIVLNLYDFCR